jgi:hypothetical protein
MEVGGRSICSMPTGLILHDVAEYMNIYTPTSKFNHFFSVFVLSLRPQSTYEIWHNIPHLLRSTLT